MKNREMTAVVVRHPQRRVLLPLFLAACVLLTGFLVVRDFLWERQNAQESIFAMDAVVSVTLRGRDAKQTAQALLHKIQELERTQLSRFAKTSDIARVNAQPGSAVPVTQETARLVRDLLLLEAQTGGAFDIRLGKLSALWDFAGQNPQVPNAKAIAAALAENRTVTAAQDSLCVQNGGILDLGAVGKGYACDIARQSLRESGAEWAVLSVGGSVLTYGRRENFRVGIRDPKGQVTDLMGELTLGERCISTSGGYERFFIRDGIRYHHILDGRSGYPSDTGVASVTVLHTDGAWSDALSTACFALGYEASLPLLEEYRADAVFVLEDGTVRLARHSGLSFTFTLLNERDYKEAQET